MASSSQGKAIRREPAYRFARNDEPTRG